jgi:hypothetical protein
LSTSTITARTPNSFRRSRLLPAAWACLLAVLPLPLSAGQAISLYEFGADDVAYLSLPAEAPKAAVLLIPDAYGDAELVAKRCDLLAKLGYVALAADLYGGEAGDPSVREKLLQDRADAGGPAIIAAAVRLLSESPRYRAPLLIFAVWGKNLPLARQAAAGPTSGAPLIALSWLDVLPEDDGKSDLALLQSWDIPLELVLNRRGDTTRWSGLLKQRAFPAEIRQYQAEPGFLFSDSKPSIDAWSDTIRFWNTAAAAASVHPEAPPAPSGPPPAPGPKPPRSKPASPRQR